MTTDGQIPIEKHYRSLSVKIWREPASSKRPGILSACDFQICTVPPPTVNNDRSLVGNLRKNGKYLFLVDNK